MTIESRLKPVKAIEIWIEPKLGKCSAGPEICRNKDFIQITKDCFCRDHKGEFSTNQNSTNQKSTFDHLIFSNIDGNNIQ